LAEVADHEIEFDILDVAEGVDGMDQRNIVALKGAKDVDERVDLAEMADVGGFFQGVLADGSYVDVFDGGVVFSFFGL